MLVELDLVEQRYQAVLEVLNDGATVTDVARRYGVRQTVHVWLRSYAAEGLQGERSGDLAVGPHGLPPGVSERPFAFGAQSDRHRARVCPASDALRVGDLLAGPVDPLVPNARQDQRPRTTPGGESRTPSACFRRRSAAPNVGSGSGNGPHGGAARHNRRDRCREQPAVPDRSRGQGGPPGAILDAAWLRCGCSARSR
jgi:transposase-like protein